MYPSSTTSPRPKELPFAPLEPPLNPDILPLISRIAGVQMELGEDAARPAENNHNFIRMCDARDTLEAKAPGEHPILPEVFVRVKRGLHNEEARIAAGLPAADDGSTDWLCAFKEDRARAQSSPKALRAPPTDAPNAPKAPRASRSSSSSSPVRLIGFSL